jgi:hypothetical protein
MDTGAEVGSVSVCGGTSWDLLFCRNSRAIELFEKVLRCLGRWFWLLIEGLEEATVDTEALELVEDVR